MTTVKDSKSDNVIKKKSIFAQILRSEISTKFQHMFTVNENGCIPLYFKMYIVNLL